MSPCLPKITKTNTRTPERLLRHHHLYSQVLSSLMPSTFKCWGFPCVCACSLDQWIWNPVGGRSCHVCVGGSAQTSVLFLPLGDFCKPTPSFCGVFFPKPDVSDCFSFSPVPSQTLRMFWGRGFRFLVAFSFRGIGKQGVPSNFRNVCVRACVW